MARILIIDDERDFLLLIHTYLTAEGHEVFPLMRATKLVEEVEKVKPDLVITDIMMPGITGSAVYEILRERFGPYLPVIVSSGTMLRLRHKDDLLAYCPKPLDFDHLNSTIDLLIKLARTNTSLLREEPDKSSE